MGLIELLTWHEEEDHEQRSNIHSSVKTKGTDWTERA
jgi:hypothetical protein